LPNWEDFPPLRGVRWKCRRSLLKQLRERDTLFSYNPTFRPGRMGSGFSLAGTLLASTRSVFSLRKGQDAVVISQSTTCHFQVSLLSRFDDNSMTTVLRGTSRLSWRFGSRDRGSQSGERMASAATGGTISGNSRQATKKKQAAHKRDGLVWQSPPGRRGNLCL